MPLSRRAALAMAGTAAAGLAIPLAAPLATPWLLRRARAAEAAKPPPRVLRISHHYPASSGDQGDFRDRLVRRFATDVTARTDGALTFEVYPAATLVKAAAQFSGLRRGALDLTLCPLANGAAELPETAIGSVPCLVMTEAQATAWRDAPAGQQLESLLRGHGVRILTWVWLPRAVAARAGAVAVPSDMAGLSVRSGSVPVADMVKAAGAKPEALPVEAISQAMRKGRLDAAIVSATSALSYRLAEQAPHVTTAAGGGACGYTLQPLMISELVFDALRPAEKAAVIAAGAALDADALRAARADADALPGAFSAADGSVSDLDAARLVHWTKLAAETGWRAYAKSGRRCADLLRLAAEVPA
ncbi:TRAP transporter substrate-binding protein DctP [Acidisphaera rubrifaciens]|uniref:Twin-arginine translocation pathway signal n=1 Tax=Acidisphaera rubrifaciens HS-AP3 TaxID=1231350 RepID=A0A0D6P6Y7_9PROT|nr:TRAP transporter substrate-binding protein DctP [Acidisphaera rubrifaciens]GAN77437.1 twin-arginine translocation pathway signal [Acidisphaera rubrifaciens HS-AP3]